MSLIFYLALFCLFSHAFCQQDQFTYAGFSMGGGGSNRPNVSLNGIAEIEDVGILRLTNETSRLIGRAFFPTALQFRNSTDGSAFSFSTAFAFAIVPEYPKLGGHGLAFTIAPTKELAGGLPSQYLGLMNSSDIGNSSNHVFAVEFDTVQDFEFGDINDNHIGVDINNLVSNSSVSAAYFGSDGTKTDLNLKSGTTIQAWVDYDGAAKVLNVTVSSFSTKPTVPVLSFPVDLSPILLDQMFVGFSASTGLMASSHYLIGWSFSMNGVAQSLDLPSLHSLSNAKSKNYTPIIASTVLAGIAMALCF